MLPHCYNPTYYVFPYAFNHRMNESLFNATLRQFEIFLVVAENQSFACAAEILGLSPPAVSMQMSQFADTVGMPLFEKSGRNRVLTPAGETLVPYVQLIKKTLREADEEMDALKGLKHGAVKIAMVSTARYFAPKLIAQFQAQHKDIEVDVAIANRMNVIKQLERNEIDLAIMGRPPDRIPLEADWFADHPYVMIASPDHPLSAKKKIAPEKLTDETFLVREYGSGTRMIFESYFAENKVKQPDFQEMTSNENIKQAVMASMGLAVISMHTIALELQTGNLAILDIKNMPVVKAWYVLHSSNRTLSPSAEAFKEFMQAEAPPYMEDFFKTSVHG